MVKYFTDALLKKPFGELTFSDLLPTLIVLSSWIIFYIISDIMSSYVGLKTYPKTKKYQIFKLEQRFAVIRVKNFLKTNECITSFGNCSIVDSCDLNNDGFIDVLDIDAIIK